MLTSNLSSVNLDETFSPFNSTRALRALCTDSLRLHLTGSCYCMLLLASHKKARLFGYPYSRQCPDVSTIWGSSITGSRHEFLAWHYYCSVYQYCLIWWSCGEATPERVPFYARRILKGRENRHFGVWKGQKSTAKWKRWRLKLSVWKAAKVWHKWRREIHKSLYPLSKWIRMTEILLSWLILEV